MRNLQSTCRNYFTAKIYLAAEFLAVFLLSLFFFASTSTAQVTSQQTPGLPSKISYTSLFNQIEQEKKIHLFYKKEWFVGEDADISLAQLPMEGVIAIILHKFANLDIVIVDELNYVFITRLNGSRDLSPQILNDALQIGNSAEYGRYTKATLSGKVTDGATGEPVPGVSITFADLKTSTTTNLRGDFTLLIPVGEHTLQLSSVGFEAVSRAINLLSNGKVEFNLFRRSYPLEEAVIAGERTDRNVTRAELGIFKMEAKTIRAIAGTFGETDIIRGATLLPGVQSPGEFGSGFIVRGGSVDQNLILVEGIPLFNSSHLFGLSAAINPDAISEMTIYKTSIPARYGERISSVMDIKLGMENTKKFNLQGGIGVLNSRLSAFIPLYNDKVTLMVSGRGSYSDWILHQIPSIELKRSSAGFYDLNAMSTIKYSATGKITAFGYLSSDDFSLNGMTDYHYENRLASLRWDFLLSKKLSAGIMAGISDYRLRVIDSDDSHPEEASRINLSTNYNTLKIGLNWFPNSDHTIRFGLDGMLYHNQPGNLQQEGNASHIVPTELQSEKGLELAAYLSDDFAITPLLAFEAGIRVVNFRSLGPGSVFIYKPGLPMTVESISDTLYYGENDKVASYSGIEPRLSLRYILNETSSIKLGYNRMNQFINLISNSSVVSPTDAWKLISYYIKPTVSNQVSLGYFKNLQKNTIETSIEVYYKKMDNVIEYKNGAKVLLNQHLETDLIAAQGYSYGVELLIRKNAGKLSGWISYTYSRSMHRTSETITSRQINGNNWFPSNFDVPHNLVINLNYQPGRRWRFTGTFYFSTGRPLTLPELQYTSAGEQLVWYSDRNEYRLPAFHRLDLSITFDKSLRIKKRWKGNWTFSIINVYGRKNAYSVFYSRENPQNWNYTGSYNLSKMYILGAPLPTLTYNFSL